MKFNALLNEFRSGIASYITAYRVVRKGYKNFNIAFLCVSILFIVTSVISAILPYLLKKTAEAFSGGVDQLNMFFYITFSYALCWTVAEVLKNLKGIFSAGILARADAALTEASLKGLLSASYIEQKKFDSAVLNANISRGASSFSGLTTSVFWMLLPIAFEIITALIFLYHTLGFFYSLIFLTSLLFLILLAVYIAVLSRNIHSDIINAMNNISSYSVSRLSLPLDIRINAAHERERNTREGILNHYVKTIKLTNRKMGLLLSVQAAATGLLLAISVLALAMYKDASNLGSGDFVMIAGYIGMLTMQLRMIAGSCIDIQRQVIYLRKLLEYIYLDSEGFNTTMLINREENLPVFELKDVSCDYNGRILFKNISFRVNFGEMTAISAPSGFGKSTVLNLILGLDSPAEGDVFFKGQPIVKDVSEYIVSQVAFVPQKTGLFPGTIRDNILYGTNDSVDDSELIAVLYKLELIKDPIEESYFNFLERIINPQGNAMSGGEVQRLSIARALIRRHDIIILDEPTASIEEELALRIVSYIRQRCSTILITTHNPRILAVSDRVYEIDHTSEGTVAKIGR